MALVRQRPLAVVRLPGWLMQGKAALKRHITGKVELDVAHLPYNRELMQFLEQEHATGRSIYLATAADKALAERVAAHVGLFAGVLASDGAVNLAGKNKLAAFRNRFGDDFSLHWKCFAGSSAVDELPFTDGGKPERRIAGRAAARQGGPGADVYGSGKDTEDLAEGDPAAPVGEEHSDLSTAAAGALLEQGARGGNAGRVCELRSVRVGDLHCERSAGH